MTPKRARSFSRVEVEDRVLKRLEDAMLIPERLDKEILDRTFRSNGFGRFYAFTSGFGNSAYNGKRWLYEAHFRVGILEKSIVAVMFPQIVIDDSGHRKPDGHIEVRVVGNLGPVGVNSLLDRIANRIGGNTTGVLQLKRGGARDGASAIRA